MKKLILAGLAVISMNAFSQSYLIMGNGITLTTDKAGFVYDFGHFTMPNSVSVNGGQFFIADERISTIDAQGFLYRKDNRFKKIKGKGLNYIVGDDNALYTVDERGFVFKFDKDANIRRASAYGGNYFLVTNSNRTVDLYTVNSRGNYFKLDIPGVNPAQITVTGGNYFRVGATVYTVSKDGFVFAKPEIKVGEIRRMGGNFFIDSTGTIFTVSDEGFLMIPALPRALNLSTVNRLGANYFMDAEGRLFVVTSDAQVLERDVTQHDVRNARTLSL
jgi:hypothetical protein